MYKTIIALLIFYSFSNAQFCDDDYLELSSDLKNDTIICKNKNLLFGRWQIDKDGTQIDNDYYDQNQLDSIFIEIKDDSISYIYNFLSIDSSYYKDIIIGKWFVDDKTFRISGKLITSKFDSNCFSEKEKSIEFCTKYSFFNGKLYFSSMRIDKLHDGPFLEVKCFQKITNK